MIKWSRTSMGLADLSASLTAQSRAWHDRWAEFSSSPSGIGLMALWACAEASVWPVIPDFLLAPMTVARQRRPFLPLAASAAGSALGGAVFYTLAAKYPETARSLLDRLPLVSAWQIRKAEAGVDRRGPAAFVVQPWTGVGFKVWAVAAAERGLAPASVLPLSIGSRTARMAVVAWFAHRLQKRLGRPLRDYFLCLTCLYVAAFAYAMRKLST